MVSANFVLCACPHPPSPSPRVLHFMCIIFGVYRRLSKKLKIGKKYFQRCPERPIGPEYVAKHQQAQKRLSDLEEVK